MRVLLALCLAVASSPAFAMEGFFDAPRLVALCNATGADAESGRSLCLGYIVGSLDQLLARQAATGDDTVCPPADLTARQALATVMHREDLVEAGRGAAAASFIQLALEQAYPCAPKWDRPWRSPSDRSRGVERIRSVPPMPASAPHWKRMPRR
jgi:hypothetical protein